MKAIVFSLLAVVFSTTSWATGIGCNINTMNGQWASYQAAVLTNPHTGVCKFKVVTGFAEGTCDFSNGFSGPFQGVVTVNNDCSANLSMDFAPVPVISDFQIQLHKNKFAFVGQWSNNHGVIGITNAVKR